MKKLKILFATSEAVPFVKTGGLADVAGSLPKSLLKLGADIRVIMPKFKSIPAKFSDKMEFLGSTYIDIGWRHQYCGVFKLVNEGVTFYFIDNKYYFDRDGYYGYPDEAEQYVFLNKAILEAIPIIDFKPDIIHSNDWQTSLIPVYLDANYKRNELYKGIRTAFTIHNLKYQGAFPKSVLTDLMGLGWEYFTPDKIEFFDQVNFMKAGLVYSNAITTVSKTYSEEIKYDFYGENLAEVVRSRSADLYGILNGIDYEENDPATDKRLFANYDAANIEGKFVNKKMLQQTLGLPECADVPVIGIISRLVDQKGFDLIAYVLKEILEEDIQLVILGTGEQKYEEMFKHAALTYPKKVSSNIKYDATLAQRIYAGCDMFLMPSLFEPCGLSQLFSLRYGTIPIVRETGGLQDTIQPFNEYIGEGNGFSFHNYNAHDMLYTIRRAITFYYNTKIWHTLIRRGMSQDFSWNKSAKEYMDLYLKLVK